MESEDKKRKHYQGEEPTDCKKTKKKPPTVEEIRNWKETENLYNSNLFRLQIEELISEIKIKNKRHKRLSSWLETFQSTLDDLPDYEILLSSIKERKLKKRKMTKEDELISQLAEHRRLFQTDQDVTLKLTKPEACEKFGLYDNNSLPGPNILLKINLVVPNQCFVMKDYLNNRYLCKRYYYLLYIAEHLKLKEIAQNVTIGFHELNSLLPILKVEPKDCDKTVVLIYATPSQDTFKAVRFLPETNNVKHDVFNTSLDNETLRNSPTVFYNSALAHDVTLLSNTKYVKEVMSEQSSIQEAVKLLCVWLKQREFDIGMGSFSENLVLYFVVYLISKHKINKYMSSYQVVRNFWSFISTHDLENNPISIGDPPKDIMDSFKKHFEIVCLDQTGYYNIAAFLDTGVYRRIKLECEIAISCLNQNKSNVFQQLFLTKLPFYLQYDLIIDLSNSLPLEDKYDIKDSDKAKFIGYNKDLLITRHITSVYKQALSKRVISFVPRLVMDENNELNKVFFGVNLNPEQAFHFIELGPPLNDHVAAADFRKFWGHLSSDRRFRDGSTNVSVYFRTNTLKGKRNIIKKILKFVSSEKLFVEDVIHYDESEEVLISKKLVPSYPSGTNEETCLKIIQASDELGKKLRALSMSLKITGIQELSDVYNFSELCPPIPANYKVDQSLAKVRGNNIIFSNTNRTFLPRYVQPIECVLHLEYSGKWPNNLTALRHIKTSFYLEISKILQTTHQILSHVTPDFIDVYFEGVVFRYQLYVPKEIALMKKATEGGVTSYRESLDSFNMEKKFNILPKVIGALKGIQATYPSFGPGTAIIRRWLRSHWIDDFLFPDIVIGILNASLYLNNVFLPANTPQIAFLRFLQYFSEFDWNLQPVIVNFNDELTNADLVDVETKFLENRGKFPTLYIVMPFDQGNSVFTKQSPSEEVLRRIKLMAKDCLSFINKVFMEQNRVGIKELFIANLEGYHVLIHLKPSVNTRRLQQIVFANPDSRVVVEKYKPIDDDKLPIIDFDPVARYLSILRQNYGKYAVFFHDTYGGNTIGVLWYPNVLNPVDFKVAEANSRMVENGKMVFNVDAVIEDFYILGKDLVKTIDKKT